MRKKFFSTFAGMIVYAIIIIFIIGVVIKVGQNMWDSVVIFIQDTKRIFSSSGMGLPSYYQKHKIYIWVILIFLVLAGFSSKKK